MSFNLQFPTHAFPHQLPIDVETYVGTTTVAAEQWQTWRKPLNATMCFFMAVGGGGGGGNGAVGANSTAAGGGGGGSGAVCQVMIPAFFLPDVLYVSAGASVGANTAGIASYVALEPFSVANSYHLIINAVGGGAGGNASGATGGTGGSSAAVSTSSTMRFGWALGEVVTYAGNTGVNGGSTGAATNKTPPTTGIWCTGGTGGGGLGAGGSTGAAGGSIVFTGALNYPPDVPGGTAGGTTTAPGNAGAAGYSFFNHRIMFWNTGGTGGASGGGAGGNGGNGGPGGWGSGGGGGGGALTGNTAGVGAPGGPGYIIIMTY